MHKGILGGKSWQSAGLRKRGERAILWGDDLFWLTATEFASPLGAEV